MSQISKQQSSHEDEQEDEPKIPRQPSKMTPKKSAKYHLFRNRPTYHNPRRQRMQIPSQVDSSSRFQRIQKSHISQKPTLIQTTPSQGQFPTPNIRDLPPQATLPLPGYDPNFNVTPVRFSLPPQLPSSITGAPPSGQYLPFQQAPKPGSLPSISTSATTTAFTATLPAASAFQQNLITQPQLSESDYAVNTQNGIPSHSSHQTTIISEQIDEVREFTPQFAFPVARLFGGLFVHNNEESHYVTTTSMPIVM
ncbi:unnamed protein product [Brugia pahangi]|uniref:Uncharacterized protein n=1 Tax=Brugia pahangi TaxID=6280 RepID=A0A0N4TS84_BRUPA|nr:unnamed protein product [Brugia pahangi]